MNNINKKILYRGHILNVISQRLPKRRYILFDSQIDLQKKTITSGLVNFYGINQFKVIKE